MGTLHYGTDHQSVFIDDHELMRLQTVITDKLRRGEHFMFSCMDDSGRRITFWMAPGIPLRFDYVEEAGPDIDLTRVSFITQADDVFAGIGVVAEHA